MIAKQPEMKTLILLVASKEEVAARAHAAAGGEAQGAFVSFTSAELLRRIVSPHRLSLIRALIGQGTLSVGELAGRVGGEAKAVDAEI